MRAACGGDNLSIAIPYWDSSCTPLLHLHNSDWWFTYRANYKSLEWPESFFNNLRCSPSHNGTESWSNILVYFQMSHVRFFFVCFFVLFFICLLLLFFLCLYGKTLYHIQWAWNIGIATHLSGQSAWAISLAPKESEILSNSEGNQ